MAEKLVDPLIDGGSKGLEQSVQQVIGLINGYDHDDSKAPFRPRYSGASAAVDIARLTNGTTFKAFVGSTNHLTLTSTGASSALNWTIGAITATSASISGNVTIGGTLSAGATTLSSLGVTNNAAVGGTLGVTGAATFSGNATFNGNTALGNADTDTVTVVGVSTFKNAAGTTTQAVFDAGNNRVIFGSATALGSDTTPAAHVVGRLYVAPESANDFAQEWRRSAAATVGWRAGVTSTNDLVFKDDGGVETFRVGDVASTYQHKVTGAANVTGSMTVGGGISAGASSAFTGGVSVVSGGISVLAGGATVTGGITVTSNGINATGGVTVATGSLVVQVGGADITGGLTVVTGSFIVSAGGATLNGPVVMTNNSSTTVFTFLGSAGFTQSTVGPAGGASALPALPDTYLRVNIGGGVRVIPAYNA